MKETLKIIKLRKNIYMLVFVHFIFKGTNITLFRHVQNKPKIHLHVCNKFEANLGKHGNL